MSNARPDAGFSLVEALVALAVFATAGVALMQLQVQSLATFAQVETRALADITAQNRLAEIIASNQKPDIGVREEKLSFAGRTWRMTVNIAATTDSATRSATVGVVEDGAEGPLSVARGFLVARASGAP